MKKIIARCSAPIIGLLLLLSSFTGILAAEYSAVEGRENINSSAIEPCIIAEYCDQEGNQADGNCLVSGTYDMKLSLTGLNKIARLQFTASYDESIVNFSNGSLLSDTYDKLEAIGPISYGSGGIAFGFFCTDFAAGHAVLPESSTVFFSAQINITAPEGETVDMNQIMIPSANPNETFIDADYSDEGINEDGDAFYNCYAIGTVEGFNGTVYPMTCDLSPSLVNGSRVSAYVGALANPTDEFGTYPVMGASVSIAVGGELLTAETDSTGKFTFENVPAGTYDAHISYRYGFERTFRIIVSDSDIESETVIGIVACDWSKDGVINVLDYGVYQKGYLSSSEDEKYNAGIDINCDGIINVLDYGVYSAFYLRSADSVQYNDVTIQ